MKVRHILLLFLMVVPVAASAQLRATTLTNPGPINIPAGVSQAAAKDAVVNAMFGRGWTIVNEDDHSVLAELHLRSHWALIQIEIDERNIRISYRDSQNLHYAVKKGREIIHKNYIGWIDSLAGDIRVQLARAQRDTR